MFNKSALLLLRNLLIKITLVCILIISLFLIFSNNTYSSSIFHRLVTLIPSINWFKESGVRIYPGSLNSPDSNGAQTQDLMRFSANSSYINSTGSTIISTQPFVRMYYGGVNRYGKQQILSAISFDEGITWQKESGIRIAAVNDEVVVDHPSLVILPDNRYRMYFEKTTPHNPGVILSATSSDGLNWIRDYGYRIDNAITADVIMLPSSFYRMYFTRNGDIYSAISGDGINFIQEEGIRINKGGEGKLDAARVNHIYILQLPDNRYRMYYTAADGVSNLVHRDGNGRAILSAISTDGLFWEKEEGIRLEIGIPGSLDAGGVVKPAILQLSDGNFRMFYQGIISHNQRYILSAYSKGLPVGNIDIFHFSQLDPEWKDDEYDFASEYNPVGYREIEDWGCALTSSAMILNYHGYFKGPAGQQTNPKTLNEYLKQDFDEKNGRHDSAFTKNGGIIWSYITKYAQDSKNNNSEFSNLPSLEFKYVNFDPLLIEQDVHNNSPGIIKIVMNDNGTPHKLIDDNFHFVTVEGINQDKIYIEDPLEINDIILELSSKYPSKEYRNYGRFIKTNSDLSYIWLYLYSENANVLIEYEGDKTGIDENGNLYNKIPEAQYFEDGAIANPDGINRFGGESSKTKVFLLPKPETGNYYLTVSDSDSEFTDFEMHVFNQNADVDILQNRIYLDNSNTKRYILNFQKDEGSTFSQPSKSLQDLIDDVWLMVDNRFIYNKAHGIVLTNFVESALRFEAENNNQKVLHFLDLFQKQLDEFYPEDMDEDAYNYLLQESEFVKLNLN